MRERSYSKRDFAKGRLPSKQNFYTKDDEAPDHDEEEENIDDDINEFLFLTIEEPHQHKKELNEDEASSVVDLEAELSVAIEEIENLRDINEIKKKEHFTAKNQLTKRMKEDTLKREVKIAELQKQLKKTK